MTDNTVEVSGLVEQTFLMSEGVKQQLDDLARRMSADTGAALGRGMAVLTWYLDARQNGERIYVKRSDGTMMEVLSVW